MGKTGPTTRPIRFIANYWSPYLWHRTIWCNTLRYHMAYIFLITIWRGLHVVTAIWCTVWVPIRMVDNLGSIWYS